MRLYDAHNHVHDERLRPWQDRLISQARTAGVARMVVNGSREEDWPSLLELAHNNPMVLPSFGYHPWYVHERTPHWQARLVEFLDKVPSAMGEIGLDKWILSRNQQSLQGRSPRTPNHHVEDEGSQSSPPRASLDAQEEVFVWQLRIAAKRNLPVSIHCLQAWGRLHDVLRLESLPTCGFLLHSYGGPVEMVRPLADLGAYFSLPGYFAHERKSRQRETFRHVPYDRFLIETDAPDQCLPDERNQFPLIDEQTGKPLNHPANLAAVYEFAADLLGESLDTVGKRVEANFQRLFG